MLQHYLFLIGLTAISVFVLLFVRFPRKRALSLVMTIVCMLLLILDGYLMIAGGEIWWRYHYLMTAIDVALFGLFIEGIVSIITRNRRIRRTVYIVACAAFLCYGMVNMGVVHRHDVSLQSEKVTAEHSFVFLSDTHEEGAQSFSQLEKAVRVINEINPEFVVLGGDITDDYTTMEKMQKTYEILGQLTAPTYFIYGNHDLQSKADSFANGVQYTEKELEDTIKANGITVLRDEYVQISDDLVIMGRMDRSYKDVRKDFYSIENPNPSACTIVFDHQQINWLQNPQDNDADFQISGHSHAGQFWPLDILYHIIDYDASGFYTHEGTTQYVSSGFAGWKVPFRTADQCRYEVIHLTN